MAEMDNARPAGEDMQSSADDEAQDTEHADAVSGHNGTDDDSRQQSEASPQTDAVLRELEIRIAELEAENTDLKDQYLRKQADFENYRRRMSREKEDAVAYANQQLLLDLTSVIDDFERAIRSAEESRDYDSFHDGVVLIERQLTSMLERKWGLTRFDSDGETFDPQRHEAVTTEERDGGEPSLVLEEYQKGYLLHDRVLRTAKVKVSVPAPSDR